MDFTFYADCSNCQCFVLEIFVCGGILFKPYLDCTICVWFSSDVMYFANCKLQLCWINPHHSCINLFFPVTDFFIGSSKVVTLQHFLSMIISVEYICAMLCMYCLLCVCHSFSLQFNYCAISNVCVTWHMRNSSVTRSLGVFISQMHTKIVWCNNHVYINTVTVNT